MKVLSLLKFLCLWIIHVLLFVMYWQSYYVISVFTVTASLINVIMYCCKDMFFVWDVQMYRCV
jgi:hypothetical protein